MLICMRNLMVRSCKVFISFIINDKPIMKITDSVIVKAFVYKSRELKNKNII